MVDSMDAGKKMMVDVVSVPREGPTLIEKRNIIPLDSVILNKTKNFILRVEDSVSKVEIAIDNVKIDSSVVEKWGLDQVGQIDSCFSKAQMSKASDSIVGPEGLVTGIPQDQLTHQTIISQKMDGRPLENNMGQLQDSTEGMVLSDVQIMLMDHSPGPNHTKPGLKKWKKIDRSPSPRCVVFGPSSPIQKLLVNRRRTQNGSKSPVTKSSPLKVKVGPIS
ncbi:hypothetical protein ACOSQ4_008238 [Xanthoceras sorbifolium]